jgi:hypothetical protein
MEREELTTHAEQRSERYETPVLVDVEEVSGFPYPGCGTGGGASVCFGAIEV